MRWQSWSQISYHLIIKQQQWSEDAVVNFNLIFPAIKCWQRQYSTFPILSQPLQSMLIFVFISLCCWYNWYGIDSGGVCRNEMEWKLCQTGTVPIGFGGAPIAANSALLNNAHRKIHTSYKHSHMQMFCSKWCALLFQIKACLNMQYSGSCTSHIFSYFLFM